MHTDNEYFPQVILKNSIQAVSDQTLGELVAANFGNADIFKKYGLDFCCGGKKTLKEACSEKGLNGSEIERELNQAGNIATSCRLPYTEWPLDFLCDYIVNTHHFYVKKVLPGIKALAVKVNQVHGAAHPELKPITDLVDMVSNELTVHMLKEENVLFPFIKKLVANAGNHHVDAAGFGTVGNPIHAMEAEHELVGHNLGEIRKLTNEYHLPADVCTSYSMLYKLLEEFEDDLHLHVHLENNILFPKAIALEKAFV